MANRLVVQETLLAHKVRLDLGLLYWANISLIESTL